MYINLTFVKLMYTQNKNQEMVNKMVENVGKMYLATSFDDQF